MREHRIKKGFTIEDLASKCEMDFSQLARMELGKVSFSASYMPKLLIILEIDPREVLP